MPVYTCTTLDDPAATNGTQAFGINNAGQIVGGYNIFAHGFLLSGGTYTTLTTAPPAPMHGALTARVRSSDNLSTAGSRTPSFSAAAPTPHLSTLTPWRSTLLHTASTIRA